jgi:hypothetical protein
MRLASYKTPVRTGVELFVVFSLFGFIGGAVVSSTGCKALTPEIKQEILQKKDVTCALENAFLSDERIAVICGLADQFLRPILDLVSAQRVALAKSHTVGVTEGAARSGGCAPVLPASLDGGVPDTGAAPASTLKDAGISKEAASPAPPKTK